MVNASLRLRLHLQEHMLVGFDFIVTPLVRPTYRPPAPAPAINGQLPEPFGVDDVLYLNSSQWTNQVGAPCRPPSGPARWAEGGQWLGAHWATAASAEHPILHGGGEVSQYVCQSPGGSWGCGAAH